MDDYEDREYWKPQVYVDPKEWLARMRETLGRPRSHPDGRSDAD